MTHERSQASNDKTQRLHRLRRVVAWLVLVVIGVAATSVALAAARGTSSQGRPLVSGGVGYAERQALHERRDDYSLWLVTAAKRSGAFLSDVRVKITDAEQRTVFEGTLDGPWLFIDLASGRYVIEARYRGDTQRRQTTIQGGDRHQAFFYFDAPEEVSPERPTPIRGNPYGN